MEKKLKIILCSSAHPYDYPRLFHRQACSLAEHFDVTIISCAPFSEKVVQDQLKVVGLPAWDNKWERFLNLFRLFKKLLKTSADVYIFYDTIGMLLIPYIKVFKRSKTIYDIPENFHGWIRQKEWIPKILRNILADSYILFEKIVLKYTDMLWFAVSDIGDHYTHFTQIKKMLVANFPSLEQFKLINRNGKSLKNQFISVAIMDANRSITQIIRAFDQFCETNKEYELILAGNFYSQAYEKEVVKLVESAKMRAKIKLLGRVPYDEALKRIAESKAGFSLHQPTYNYLRGMPLKLLEYAGMGIPVIASNFGNFKRIVETTECGKCADPNNINEIVNAMHFVVEDEKRRRKMGVNGKKLVENEYNWEKISVQMVQAINDLCSDA